MNIIFFILVILGVSAWLGVLHHREGVREILLKYDIKSSFYNYPWGEWLKIDDALLNSEISTEDKNELTKLKTKIFMLLFAFIISICLILLLMIAFSITNAQS